MTSSTPMSIPPRRESPARQGDENSGHLPPRQESPAGLVADESGHHSPPRGEAGIGAKRNASAETPARKRALNHAETVTPASKRAPALPEQASTEETDKDAPVSVGSPKSAQRDLNVSFRNIGAPDGGTFHSGEADDDGTPKNGLAKLLFNGPIGRRSRRHCSEG